MLKEMKSTHAIILFFSILMALVLISWAFGNHRTLSKSLMQVHEVLFMIINLDRNIERFQNVTSTLDYFGSKYVRISAVDGFSMDSDVDVQHILKPRLHLLNQNFNCLDNGDKWVYDGSIESSFPHLHLHGHYGTKGLTLSNIKALSLASIIAHSFRWFCILEDDVEIDDNVYHDILNTCRATSHEEIDFILMDTRANGFGGTCAICYSSHVVGKCKDDLHPLSEFSLNTHKLEGPNANIWDWKLWKYVKKSSRNFLQVPIVFSGNFPSTIDVT
jgi:hypothetical protein